MSVYEMEKFAMFESNDRWHYKDIGPSSVFKEKIVLKNDSKVLR